MAERVGFEPTAHLGSGLVATRIAALAPLRTTILTVVSRNRIRHFPSKEE